MSNRDYAKHYCCKKLDLLCNSYNEKEYEDLINVASEYELEDVKLTIYTELGDYFFKIQKYNFAIRHLQKAYDISIKIDKEIDFLKLLTKISTCYFSIDNMKCYTIITVKGIHNNSIEFPLFYNLAAYHKKSNNYTLALELLKKTISLENLEEAKINHSMLLKANVLLLMENYSETLNIYKYLLDHDKQFIHNMAYAFNKLKDQEKSIKFLNQSINIQLENDEATITISLIDLGKIYFEKKKYIESITFYQYSLDSCIKNKQPEYIFKCYNTLLDLYKLTNFLYIVVKQLLNSNAL